MFNTHQINVTPMDAQQGSKVLVHNIPPNLCWKAVKDHFKQWGNVVHVALWALPEDGATLDGEVRFDDPAQVAEALKLNGSLFGGVPITVELDPGSQDHAKVKISGLPQGTRWQELKDHFSGLGTIAFAGIKGVDGVSGKASSAAMMPAVGMPANINALQKQMYAMIAAAMGQVQQQQRQPQHPQSQQFPRRPAHAAAPPNFAAQDGGMMAELRFQDPQNAMVALKEMNGELCGGRPMVLQLDLNSVDQRTLIVKGLDKKVTPMQIRALFASRIGQVTSCEVRNSHSKAAPGNVPTRAARLGGGHPGGGQAQMLQQAAAQMVMMQRSQGFGGGAFVPRGVGEVRFEGPAASSAAEVAVGSYNGMDYKGSVIAVTIDNNSQDRTKILIRNLPPNTAWQELKDMFSECGPVAFANVR